MKTNVASMSHPYTSVLFTTFFFTSVLVYDDSYVQQNLLIEVLLTAKYDIVTKILYSIDTAKEIKCKHVLIFVRALSLIGISLKLKCIWT